MLQVCYGYGSFSMGTLVLLSHLKTLVQLFTPFFKIVKLALNSTSFFSLLTIWESADVCVSFVMYPAVLYMAHRIELIG